MSLKFPFRDVFYKKVLRPKRLWAVLEDMDTRITSATGSDTSLGEKITALETVVGKASGDGAGGIAKDVSDLKTAVGEATGDDAGGIAKDVADLITAIGDESTENSILARIKALEDAE